MASTTDKRFTLADFGSLTGIINQSVYSDINPGLIEEAARLAAILSADPEVSRFPLASPRHPDSPPVMRGADAMAYSRNQQQLHYTLIQREERLRQADDDSNVSSAAWTGSETRRARLVALRAMLPQADLAVQALLATVGYGDNGGPLLDDESAHEGGALQDLRTLHENLGHLLRLIDTGRFDDENGEGLVADSVRISRDLLQVMKDKPVQIGLLASVWTALSIWHVPGFDLIAGLISIASLRR